MNGQTAYPAYLWATKLEHAPWGDSDNQAPAFCVKAIDNCVYSLHIGTAEEVWRYSNRFLIIMFGYDHYIFS